MAELGNLDLVQTVVDPFAMAHLKASTMFSASTKSSNLACFSDETALVRGKDLLNQGQPEAALFCLQTAEQSIQAPENYVLQAVCFILLNRPEAALQVCDRALDLDAEYAQAWLFRGAALHRLGQFQASYRCYRRALKQQASSSPTWLMVLRDRLMPLKLRLKRLMHHRWDQWVH